MLTKPVNVEKASNLAAGVGRGCRPFIKTQPWFSALLFLFQMGGLLCMGAELWGSNQVCCIKLQCIHKRRCFHNLLFMWVVFGATRDPQNARSRTPLPRKKERGVQSRSTAGGRLFPFPSQTNSFYIHYTQIKKKITPYSFIFAYPSLLFPLCARIFLVSLHPSTIIIIVSCRRNPLLRSRRSGRCVPSR